MLAVLSAYDENEKQADKKKVGFLHISSNDEESIQKEVSPYALAFARKFNLEKVYLLYGEKGKIIYEFNDSLQ